MLVASKVEPDADVISPKSMLEDVAIPKVTVSLETVPLTSPDP
jgi:hypothetical protein